jgi:hypothetical protein
VAEHASPLLQATVRERDIGRDRDIAWRHAFGDPVVGGVESPLHNDKFNELFSGYAKRGIGNNINFDLIAPRDAVDFFFDGAGVSIKINGHSDTELQSINKQGQAYQAGWDEERIRKLAEYYDKQTEGEQVGDHEAAFQAEGQIVMVVPTELVPDIVNLISNKRPA